MLTFHRENKQGEPELLPMLGYFYAFFISFILVWKSDCFALDFHLVLLFN